MCRLFRPRKYREHNNRPNFLEEYIETEENLACFNVGLVYIVSMTSDKLTHEIIGAAIEVHRYWGPGLYENIYEKSMCRELHLREIPFTSRVQLPLRYKGEIVGADLRLDILVDKTVVIEIKSVICLEAIHEAQLLSYLRLTKCRVGLLINFNASVLKSGLKRMVL